MTQNDEDERNLHADYRNKHIHIPAPKPVRNALSQLLAKKGYAQIQTANACTTAWREAVGEKIAASTRPGNVRRGILEVLVRNNAVLQDLAFLKTKAVRALTRLIPEQQIKDIRFRVGTID
jgi:predicted nucleic acid-binding Zn ribbon protein